MLHRNSSSTKRKKKVSKSLWSKETDKCYTVTLVTRCTESVAVQLCGVLEDLPADITHKPLPMHATVMHISLLFVAQCFPAAWIGAHNSYWIATTLCMTSCITALVELFPTIFWARELCSAVELHVLLGLAHVTEPLATYCTHLETSSMHVHLVCGQVSFGGEPRITCVTLVGCVRILMCTNHVSVELFNRAKHHFAA